MEEGVGEREEDREREQGWGRRAVGRAEGGGRKRRRRRRRRRDKQEQGEGEEEGGGRKVTGRLGSKETFAAQVFVKRVVETVLVKKVSVNCLADPW